MCLERRGIRQCGSLKFGRSFVCCCFGVKKKEKRVFCSELQQHPGRASTQNPDADTPGLSAGGRGQGDTHLVWASGRRTGLVDVFGVT